MRMEEKEKNRQRDKEILREREKKDKRYQIIAVFS